MFGMWKLVGKLATGMPSVLSQITLSSYDLIYLILDSSLSILASCLANLVS